MGKNGNSERLLFSWAPKSLQMVTTAMKLNTLAPWKKSYDQSRQYIKKQRHYFTTKVRLFKAMAFPVVMCGCESWTSKKAEHWRIDAFELWCWRRLFRVLWTARRSNESILKEISPEYSLEGLMLKFQYFGHMIWRTDSTEKTLMLGKIEGGRRREQQRKRWLIGISDLLHMSLSKLQELVMGQESLACCSPWGHKESDTTEWLNLKKHKQNVYAESYKTLIKEVHKTKIINKEIYCVPGMENST